MPLQLVVIAPHVANRQSLIDQLGSTYSYLLLSADLDGVTQIADYVAANPGFDAVHLISHGSPGLVALGTSTLAGSTLGRYSAQLEQIGASLKAGSDLLIYGCGVAKGDAGQQLITDISRLTRLDAAASTNKTGGTGDWVLEASVGLTGFQLPDLRYAWALDTLVGTSGNDTINGLAGNDRIDGQAGNDVISGGEGDDTLEGNFGNDTLYGEAGNDTLTDDQGANLLDGGAGSDNLTTSSLSGNSTLIGGLDNDSLYATGLTVSLSGGDGNDNLNANGIPNTNNSAVYVQGGAATLDGGAGNDSLNVSYYSQATLRGGDGNDNLSTFFTRTAQLYGEDGKDNIFVQYENSWSQKTDGNLSLGTSYLVDGGADDDTLTVNGFARRDAGQVVVVMRGGAGSDKLTLADNLASTIAGDYWVGVSQATLEGGDGDDEISVAGVLQATLTGGAGVDTFMLMTQQYKTLLNGLRVITTDAGQVSVSADPLTVTDFATGAGGDVLNYSDLLKNGSTNYDGSNPFASGYLALVQSGADTLLKFDADGSAGTAASSTTLAILKNVTASALLNTNFNPNFPTNGASAAGQTINGTSAADKLIGGFDNETISGLEGNDRIDGQAGNDVISGGDGADTLEGNFGNDTLYGEAGNDTLTDDQGANLLDGGAGSDWLMTRSLSGNSTFIGGLGDDFLDAKTF